MPEPYRQTLTQLHIRPRDGHWTIRAGGALIADTDRALELIWGGLAPVLYFPRPDVAMDLLDRLDTQTPCPIKGLASHFAIVTPAGRVENAAWSYESPRQHVGALAGHLAFDEARVTLART